jgi:asparagine synthase (glutamine-hydrolysing)
MRTWADYLVHGIYDHSTDTFFSGVQSLEPGHTLKLQDGRETIRCYWDLPALSTDQLSLTDDEACEEFIGLFRDAVRLRLRSDVPLGINLSGGLDSASLMTTIDSLIPERGELKTFTAVFGDARYDEQNFAARVRGQNRWSRHLQQLNQGAVWHLASEALYHQEAPYGGIATLAYHHLHRLARDVGVTVLLEGQGVDEMLAGYAYFRSHYYVDLLEQQRWQELRRELACANNWRFEMDCIRRLRRGGGLNVYQDGTRFLETNCVAPEVTALAQAAPEFPKPYPDHLRNALYRDLRFTKLPRVLRMNDRLSMAFSRELREPYLDHRVVEFLFRLRAQHKIRKGQTKYLLRFAMTGKLPDSVRLPAKRSVVTPQREWLRSVLRPEVENLVYSRSFASRGLFDAAKVRAKYGSVCKGEVENSFYVWQWINTELWFRQFVDEKASHSPAINAGRRRLTNQLSVYN